MDIKKAESMKAVATKFLLRNQSFYATVMLGLVPVPEMDEEFTMATDGRKLFYGLPFILASSQGKVTFVVLHEVLHVILKHMYRRGSRDASLWNTACDHVVNGIIVKFGLKNPNMSVAAFKRSTREDLALHARSPEYQMPEDGVFDPKYYGMTAEQVYDILKREQDQGGKDKGEGEGEGEGTDGDCPWGNFTDAAGEDGKPLSGDELIQAEKEITRLIKTAESIAKGRGQMPAEMSQLIADLDAPSQDWDDELSEHLIAKSTPSDFSFARPNRRFMSSDMIMPSVESVGLGHIGIFTDASGSVEPHEFKQFMSDTMDICEGLSPEQMTLIQFDYHACEPEIIEQGDEPEMVRRSNGGTRFSAPFERAEQDGLLEEMDVIIVFTDGGDNTFPDEPDCPVIWVTTNAFYRGDPPFGKIIYCNLERK